MIRINNIKLNLKYTSSDIEKIIKKTLRISHVPKYSFARLSLDDRRPNQVKYIASIDVDIELSEKKLKSLNNNNIMSTSSVVYHFPASGNTVMKHRPIVIGTGPCGLFAALYLAKAGFKPIVFERGLDVDSRTRLVNEYWNGQESLRANCNVQFGEGGAGTFSDGKLNTVIKDQSGRRTCVLDTFVKYGANPNIMYINKPHIGTDVLSAIVKAMRQDIIAMGGEVHFHSLFCNFTSDKQSGITHVVIKDLCSGEEKTYNTQALVLAIGHSARDTFKMLYEQGVIMEQKPFAMGLRIEHKRVDIDRMKYGNNPEYSQLLPAADYKLTYQASNHRAVYSFCMCPGGYVVNASSEEGQICVNGMSYSGRNGVNSNSAIVVNVNPSDFESSHPLAGVEFQRKWEKAAYEAGEGHIPVQLLGDYRNDIPSTGFKSIKPSIKGSYKLTSLKCCLPEYVKDAIIEGVMSFDKRMPGYYTDDAVLSGIEARTSSPVRIIRNDEYVCEGTNIYPCGEGAGYAGGITSAAVDGLKIAEAIVSKYTPPQ